MLGLFSLLSNVGQWHTVWSFLPTYPQFIIYSTYLSSGSASVFQRRCLTLRNYKWNPILSIPNTQSKLLITKPGSLGIKPVNSIKCNGAITLSGKLLGRRRNLFGLTVHTNHGDEEDDEMRPASFPYLARQMSWCCKPRPGGGRHPP